MALADEANRYIDDEKPWVQIKEEGKEAQVQAVCTQGLNLFRVLIAYLAPVLPFTSARASEFLGVDVADWGLVGEPLLGRTVNAFQPLLMRVDPVKVEAVVADSKESLQATPAEPAAPAADANRAEITTPKNGTFYRKPSPDKDNFVEVGSTVKLGDTVCTIEAMKLFNEIESEVSGRIVKILVDDNSPVEYDQPLFLVEPA